MRIGVYICHCGGNIADVVDVKKISDSIRTLDSIIFAKDLEHTCSEEGQNTIVEDIKTHHLDRVVIAACSPLFHEKTFMKLLEKAGLNPYMFEMANIREQCSWCHPSKSNATRKAEDLVKMAIKKSQYDRPLQKTSMTIGNRVLVVGGGIAGIQASLDLADSGFDVYMVEKEPAIGGKMAKLSKTFPTEDCATCIIGPKLTDVSTHPNIHLYTYTEIKNIEGFLGNFTVTLTKKPRYVIQEKCVSCGTCAEKCPTKVPDAFNEGLSERKAIYIHNAIAVPRKYLIDADHCRQFNGQRCGICEKVCSTGAIHYQMLPEEVILPIDTIIIATGYDPFQSELKTVYGYGKYENVISALQLERIIATGSSGPPLRPLGNRIAFIQCVGSRDEQSDHEHCSRICCMYATKLAQLVKRINPNREVYIFYTDIRAYGKGFEEYYKRAQNAGIKYIRGRTAEILEDPTTKKLTMRVEDTLSRQMIEGEFDVVVLSNGLMPAKSTDSVANFLKLAKSPDGFLQEAHPKFRPVDTLVDGVFIAGCAQGPKDIPDTVSQASAAAARAIRLMNKGEFDIEPISAFVSTEKCDGCEKCIAACPAKAIQMIDQKAFVQGALCKGCGLCCAYCPTEAIDLAYYSKDQIMGEIETALSSKKPDETRVLIFADNTCAYRLADNVGTTRLSYPAETRVIRLPSCSRITPNMILYAFAKGADGLFFGECDHKASPFTGATEAIQRNIRIAQSVMKTIGVDGNRIFFTELLASLLTDYYKAITNLIKIAKKEARPLNDNLRQQLLTASLQVLTEEKGGAL